MNYSLSYSLGKTMVVTRGDADANAYIAAVEAAGATVTSTQRNAIDDFYVSAKTSSYYTSLKRLYFPIWGVAAANAIDMISLTSGTFVGGVTHAAGYVQGNRTTGYFDIGATPAALGITNATGTLGSLVYDDDTIAGNRYVLGARTIDPDGEVSFYRNSSAFGFIGRTPGTIFASEGVDLEGICIISRTSTTSLIVSRRKTSGYTTGTRITTNSSSELISSTRNLYALGLNNGGSLLAPTDAKVGSVFVGLGLADATMPIFSLDLKNLFEGCTGLTLP